MNSFSIADELDEAVTDMLAGVAITGANTDLEIGELAGIEAELRLLPKPKFKLQLKAKLSGTTVSATSTARRIEITSCAKRDMEVTAILPTLTGANREGYPMHQRNFAASLFMHVSVLALVVVSGVLAAHHPIGKTIVTTRLILPDDYPLSPAASPAHGGGGDHDPLKASKGAPPRFSSEQLAPPEIVVRNQQSKLPVEATVIGPPAITFPQIQTGDLFSKILAPSNGPGSGGGIGDTHGTGVGGGDDPGVGVGRGGSKRQSAVHPPKRALF
jgi:hypothetical protein